MFTPLAFNQESIVTRGLVLYLDAADRTSYSPGSGVWRDLSGNGNDVTLYNTPSFDNNSITFNGTDEYARTTNTLNLSPYNQITIEIAFSPNTTSTPTAMLFEHSSNWNTQTMGFGLVPNSTGNTNYTSNRHHTNQPIGGKGRYEYDGLVGVTPTIHTNIWSKITDSTGRLSYINGILRTPQQSTSTGNYSNFRNDYLYIASRDGTSLFYNVDIFYILIYGKKLSSNEITQNYNALKGRFGL
jgi:hypothetical protein